MSKEATNPVDRLRKVDGRYVIERVRDDTYIACTDISTRNLHAKGFRLYLDGVNVTSAMIDAVVGPNGWVRGFSERFKDGKCQITSDNQRQETKWGNVEYAVLMPKIEYPDEIPEDEAQDEER